MARGRGNNEQLSKLKMEKILMRENSEIVLGIIRNQMM
jgi:hypothetical protein